jgi:hypothetical protein
MIIYNPEALIGAFAMFVLININLIINHNNKVAFWICQVLIACFAIFMYVLLSVLKNYGFVPCLEILSNQLGGCV